MRIADRVRPIDPPQRRSENPAVADVTVCPAGVENEQNDRVVEPGDKVLQAPPASRLLVGTAVVRSRHRGRRDRQAAPATLIGEGLVDRAGGRDPREHGARNFCINAGGDIAARGHVRADEPWRVGIRHPDQPDMSAAVVGAAGRLAIVGPDLTYADAYATAVFVMGVDGLDWLAEHHPEYAGFVITRDDRARSTLNFGTYRIS